MSEDKPKGEDTPKMKFPPLKKKHRILGELPPNSQAALHHPCRRGWKRWAARWSRPRQSEE